MLYYLLLGLSVVLLFYFVQFQIHKIQINRDTKNIPFLPSLPVLGFTLTFLGKNIEQFVDFGLKYLTDPSTALTRKAWFGPFFAITTSDPDIVQHILTSPDCSQRPYHYKFLRGAEGLLATDSENHKKNRKLLLPSFNSKILKGYTSTIDRKTQQFVDILGREADTGRMINIYDYFTKFTFDLSTNTLASTPMDLQETEKVKTLMNALVTVMDIITERIFKPWLYPDFIYKLTKTYKIQEHNVSTILDFMEEIRANKMKEIQRARETGEPPFVKRNGRIEWDESQLTPIVLACKLISEGAIDEYQGKSVYHSIFGGGFDTTATTLGNAFLMLAMHPHVQERLYNEIVAVHGSNPDADIDVTKEVPYVEMVIKETLRLFPVFPLIGRRLTKDTEIKGSKLPAGTVCMLFFYRLHREQSIWGTDADLFIPERFNDENNKTRHPFAFVPFSSGPKTCIGVNYSWFVLKKILPKVILNYKFSTDVKLEDIRFIFHATLSIINKDRIIVEKRRPQ